MGSSTPIGVVLHEVSGKKYKMYKCLRKKGSKVARQITKGTSRIDRQRKYRSYFKTKDYRAVNLTAPVNEIFCYISTETSTLESHEKIFLNTCDQNRSSNENPQRHLLIARQLKVLYTRCSL